MSSIKRKTRIFTDGACSDNPGPGGWASVFIKSTEIHKLTGYELHTTNNRMELRAVVEVLRKISVAAKRSIADTDFEISSDSAYVINAVNNNWITKWKLNNWKTTKLDDVKNRDLWEKFCEYRQIIEANHGNLIFIKVKGHAGNSFNELVDKLAKEEVLKAKAEIKKQKEGANK